MMMKMMNRSISRTIVIPIVILLGAIGGCASTERAGDSAARGLPPRPAKINHIVFFKLKDPADADALIADCDARLGTIPGVVSYFTGRHVDTGRPTVDSDYDVGFFVGFNTFEDYTAYVDHPDHIAVVQEWRPRFEWIVVRDVLDDRW